MKWGVIGGASIALHAVMPAIRQSRYGEIAAVASRDLSKAQQLAARFEIPQAYGSYEELLADERIDAVYIPLPNHLHREWTLQAARAGKHVLCEKPIALTADEAAEMEEQCKAAGVHLEEAFMYRHHPRMTEIKSLLAAGEIGDVRGMHSVFTFNNAEDVNNIRCRPEWGGGALYDVGCYPLSAARYLLESEPVAVTVHAMFSEQHGHVDMMASGLVELERGIALTFDCGMWAEHRQTIELLGTDGRIVIPLAFNGAGETAEYFIIKGNEKRTIIPTAVDPYVCQIDNFARAVAGEQTLALKENDSVFNMRLLEACLTSARHKERIIL